MQLYEMEFSELVKGCDDCPCGRAHTSGLKYGKVGRGAVELIAQKTAQMNITRACIVADENTYAAAGHRVKQLLEGGGIGCDLCILPIEKGMERPEPDEFTVGHALMELSCHANGIIGVGGGVVNDVSKVLATGARLPYIYIPTAPSMDGYTSDSASMIHQGLKVSLPCKGPDVLLCDTEILALAPKKLLLSGIGDMAAKLVSVCEWRISALINGEYYCETVAKMMRKYCRVAFLYAKDAVKGSPEAIGMIAEGLASVGMAMSFAKTTRPASGVEHYYSHLWDMRALENGRQSELHGLQVGVGTLLALEKYEKLKNIVPNREKALSFAARFDISAWERDVRDYFGHSAEKIIEIEHREGKYDREKHGKRLDRIIENWDGILQIINEELVPASFVRDLFCEIGHPVTPNDVGITFPQAERDFLHTGDIRDKYILSRLLWDLGELY